MSSVVDSTEFRDTVGGIAGRSRHVLAVVAESAHPGEKPRERAERGSVARGQLAVGAFDPRGPRRDAGCPVAVGVVALKLAEAAADAAVLRGEVGDRIAGRVVHRDVLREVLGIAGVVDAVAELLVTAGFEAVVEEAHVREHLAADEETAGRGEVLGLEVPLDGKARVVVVAGRKRRGLREGELDVTAHVVGVGGLELVEGGVEPVLRNGHVRVDEREQVGVRVADAGVARGVGGLDVGFVVKRDPVVVVRADDVGGAIGGVVVDDGDVVVVGRLLGKERVERSSDTVGVVVDWGDQLNRHELLAWVRRPTMYGSMRSRLIVSTSNPCLQRTALTSSTSTPWFG